MKFFAVVFLLVIYLKSYFQCFSQVQNPSANLNPKEPDGNPSEFQKKFPKNTPALKADTIPQIKAGCGLI